jgi:hypothetical protein
MPTPIGVLKSTFSKTAAEKVKQTAYVSRLKSKLFKLYTIICHVRMVA